MRRNLLHQSTEDENGLTRKLVQQLDSTLQENARLRAALDEAISQHQAAENAAVDLNSELLTGNVMGITGFTAREARERFATGGSVGISHEDMQRLVDTCRRARLGLSGSEIELCLTDRAGERRWVRINLTPTRLADKQQLYLQGIVTDISEQRRVECAMDSLNQASSIVQYASLGRDQVLKALTSSLAALDLVSVILEVQESDTLVVSAHHMPATALQTIESSLGSSLLGAAFDMHQVPAFVRLAHDHEIQQFPGLERAWREVLPIDMSELAALLNHLAPSLLALALPMVAQGQLLGVLVVGTESPLGPIRSALATFANQAAIALRNARLVEELAEREEQYRSIFQATNSGLAVVDSDGTIVQANPALHTILGRDSLTGTRLQSLLDVDDTPRGDEIVARIGQGKAWHGSASAIAPNGNCFPIELHCGPVVFGGKLQALIVLDDRTEQVQAHAALVRAERLQALGQMAGGIAHDFNNILVGIRGFADLALLDIDEDADALRQDLDHIMRGANDAAEAVRRLQSLYRVSDDTSDFQVQQVDDLIRDVLALTRPRWKDQPQAQGVTIQVRQELGTPPEILGNGSELRRVLTNLIVNAIEAMPEGGELCIRTFQQPGHSLLTIADTGLGIPAAKLESIFEPFYSTKESSGLGLAIAKNIIERHDGSISVSSLPDVGTQFEIRLPWYAKVAPKEQAPAQDETGHAQLTILVVDDEAAVLGLLSRLLTRAGHRVESASSGQQALGLLAENAYDLLITDLGMPDVSGYEVVESAHHRHPDMPIILSTGWGDSITPAKLAELYAVALLTKPFTHQEVSAALDLALGDES